jgi:FixJ family two-component response regulator
LTRDCQPCPPARRRSTRSASTKEFAAELGISLKTAEVHRARVFEKMQVNGLADLVGFSRHLGLVLRP